jgi:hypothetical protein
VPVCSDFCRAVSEAGPSGAEGVVRRVAERPPPTCTQHSPEANAFFRCYGDPILDGEEDRRVVILDVGSQDINGTLRSYAPQPERWDTIR